MLAAAIIALILLAAGIYLVRFALLRSDSGFEAVVPAEEKDRPETEGRRTIRANNEAFRAYTEEFISSAERETVRIPSYDGLTLEADFFHSPSHGHDYAILVHGYKCTRSVMHPVAAVFCREWGYSVLTPDCRAHGRSGGKWIGMGWLDKDDIRAWCSMIASRDSEARIVLFGVSMGAAAVMMASGTELPGNVIAAIEDCGYTSAWDIFRDELRALYHLPAFPILHIFSSIARIAAGYTPREASSIRMLGRSKLPMLFLHGGDDSFVSTSMLTRCFEAKKEGYKEKRIIPDAGHAEAYVRDPAGYFTAIHGFLRSIPDS